MKKDPRAVPAPAPAPAPIRVNLIVPPWWFAAGFSLVALAFLAVYWEQFPFIPELFRAYWRRDARFLLPRWPVAARTWLANGRSTAFLAGFLLLSWWAGRRALAWAVRREPDRLVRALFAVGLGNGLLGTLTLGLGLAGLLDPRVFWPLCVGGLAVGAWRGRVWRGIRIGAEAVEVREAEGPPARAVEAWLHGAAVLLAAACLAGLALYAREWIGTRRLAPLEWAAGIALALAGVLGWGVLWHWSGLAERAGTWVTRGLVAFVAMILVLNFIPAFEPEWFYDSLVYHLAVPEQWLLEHRICYLGHTFFSNFPFLEEMQFTVLLALGDDVAPKLLHWAHGALVMAGTWALAAPVVGPAGGWLAVAVLAAQPTVRFLSHITMVELGLTWFEVLATLAWVRACAAGSRGRGAFRWLLLGGWFLGFGQGTKYIGLFSSGLLLGWWGLRSTREHGAWRRAAFGATVAVAWASVWTGVWLGKNWLFTGNPFFPLVQSVFGGIGWDASNVARWMHDNTKYGTGHGSLAAWLMMPVKASIDIPDFGTFTLNPYAVLFLPLLALVPRVPERVRWLALYAAGYAVIWAVSSQQVRFLYPAMPQAAVAVAFAILEVGRGAWVARGAVTLAAGWLLVIGAFGMVHNRFSNNALVPFTTGHLDRLGLLRLGVQYYETVEYAGTVVGARDRVLFVAGDENFYLPRRRICNSIYDRSWLGDEARRAADARGLLKSLHRRRVTHLLVHEARGDEYAGYGIYDWGRKAQDLVLEVWHTWARPVYGNRGVFLFALQDRPIPAAERKTGRPSYFYPGDVVVRCKDLVLTADRAFAADKPAEGLVASEELVRLMPDVSHPRAYRAYALGLLGRRKAAAADYELAIKFGWPTAVVYYNLGVLLEGDKKYERCLDLYRQALEIDPELDGPHERSFEVALALRRWGVALAHGEALMAAKPADMKLAARVARLRQLAAAPRN